jgi:hypothetical protein
MAKTETGHAGGFILSESNGNFSRDNIEIALEQNLLAGQVISKLTSGSFSGDYVAFDQDGSDGSQTPIGIVLDDCDATTAAKAAAVLVRDAEVNGNELVWPSDITGGETDTAVAVLKTLGIIVR